MDRGPLVVVTGRSHRLYSSVAKTPLCLNPGHLLSPLVLQAPQEAERACVVILSPYFRGIEFAAGER